MSKINATLNDVIKTNDGNQYFLMDNTFTNNCPWSSQEESNHNNVMFMVCSNKTLAKNLETGEIASKLYPRADADSVDFLPKVVNSLLSAGLSLFLGIRITAPESNSYADANAVDFIQNAEFSYSNGMASTCYQDCCEFQNAMILNQEVHTDFSAHLACA